MIDERVYALHWLITFVMETTIVKRRIFGIIRSDPVIQPVSGSELEEGLKSAL